MVLFTSQGSSSLTDDQDFYSAAIFSVFILSLLIALQNLLVIASVSFYMPKNYSFSAFLFSASITDILRLFGPVSLSLHIYITKNRGALGFSEQDDVLCQAQSWLITFLRMTSTLSIMLLSVDRSISLGAQNFYQKKWKGWNLVAVVLLCWIISAFFASWPMLFDLSDSKPLAFCSRIYCLYKTNSPYSLVFTCIQFSFIVASAGCIFYATNSSRQSLFRASYSSSTGKMAVHKTRHLVHEQYHQKVSKMAALVVGVYSVCLLPWLIALLLDYFSISYPQIYGFVSLQLPMVSSLCNPIIYGVIWPPFRRAYERALAAPLRMCRKRSSSRPCNLEDSHRSYNFWTIDRMNADQQVSTLNRSLDSSARSHEPIDFMPRELSMFENDGLTADSISIDMSLHNLNDMSSFKGTTESVATATTVLDVSAQFQSILDLIEEMTDGKTKASFSTSQTSLKRSRSKTSCSNASSIDRSAVKYKDHASINKTNDSSVSSVDRSAVRFIAHAPNEGSVSSVDRSVVKRKGHARNGMKTNGSSVDNIDKPVVKRKRHALNGSIPQNCNLNSIDRSAEKRKRHALNGGIPKRCSFNSIDESEVIENVYAPNGSDSATGSSYDSIERSAVKYKAHAPNMKINDSSDSITERSAAKPSEHAPAGLANGDNHTVVEEENNANSCINARVASCTCIGKSKCYRVDNRYLDYLVNEQIHIAQGSESVIVIDV